MSRRLVLALAALVGVAIVLAEVLLQPAAGDRWHLWLIIAGPAVVAVAITPVLARWVAGRASVAGVALTVALCSLALGTVSSSAASNAMFVSSHDYRLFLVVLFVSSGISLIVGAYLTRPLAPRPASPRSGGRGRGRGRPVGPYRHHPCRRGRRNRTGDRHDGRSARPGRRRAQQARGSSTALVHQHRPRSAHPAVGDAGGGREHRGRCVDRSAPDARRSRSTTARDGRDVEPADRVLAARVRARHGGRRTCLADRARRRVRRSSRTAGDVTRCPSAPRSRRPGHRHGQSARTVTCGAQPGRQRRPPQPRRCRRHHRGRRRRAAGSAVGARSRRRLSGRLPRLTPSNHSNEPIRRAMPAPATQGWAWPSVERSSQSHGGTISLGDGPGGAVHVLLPASPTRSNVPSSNPATNPSSIGVSS